MELLLSTNKERLIRGAPTIKEALAYLIKIQKSYLRAGSTIKDALVH